MSEYVSRMTAWAKAHPTRLFISGQEGYKAYRIPDLVVSNKGTMLAICEARKKSFSDKGDIDLAIKRSFDNGRTWTEMEIIQDDGDNTVGNPCPVVDRETGTIWLAVLTAVSIEMGGVFGYDEVPQRAGTRLWIQTGNFRSCSVKRN